MFPKTQIDLYIVDEQRESIFCGDLYHVYSINQFYEVAKIDLPNLKSP